MKQQLISLTPLRSIAVKSINPFIASLQWMDLIWFHWPFHSFASLNHFALVPFEWIHWVEFIGTHGFAILIPLLFITLLSQFVISFKVHSTPLTQYIDLLNSSLISVSRAPFIHTSWLRHVYVILIWVLAYCYNTVKHEWNQSIKWIWIDLIEFVSLTGRLYC